MKILCKYAVLRFMPYAETQEFANIGIVISVPKQGVIVYKLAPPRFARVTKFFEDLDGQMYKKAVNRFADELQRVQVFAQELKGEQHIEYFKEVTRFRESVIHFSEMHTLLCNNPQETLNQLYERYVGRQFITKQYREAQMVRALKQTLNTRLPIKYKERELQADYLSVKMPLVAETGANIRAIKPMTFQQSKALTLIEHGETWIGRINRLIKSGSVVPDHIMFTVEAPEKTGRKLQKAFNEVITEMKELGVAVSNYDETKEIIQFAAADMSLDDFKLVTH